MPSNYAPTVCGYSCSDISLTLMDYKSVIKLNVFMFKRSTLWERSLLIRNSNWSQVEKLWGWEKMSDSEPMNTERIKLI